MIALADIVRCFQGEIPSIIATCSADGDPNIGHLSQVFFVDDDHVAVSNQFFSKTTANLAANPVAALVCVDPVTLISYRLLVQHEYSEDSGPRFEAFRASIDAIAALTKADFFALKAVDVFRVLDVEALRTRANATST